MNGFHMSLHVMMKLESNNSYVKFIYEIQSHMNFSIHILNSYV